MDEREDIDGESRRPSFSPIRIRHLAPSPIKKVEVYKSDEGDEDNSEEITAVESPIVAEPRSGDSGPPYLEDLKEHGRDDTELRVGEPSSPPPEAKGDHPDGEDAKTEMVDERDEECNEDNSAEITAVELSIMAEPRSSDLGSCIDDPELNVGESSPPPPEAKGDHPDGKDEDNNETPGLASCTSSSKSPSSRSANQDIDIDGNRMSSPDISTMKTAVQSGSPKAVHELMGRLSDSLAVDELTTTYGGGDYSWQADTDDLFRGTSPILHTARSGNRAVFESVMKAMKEKLSREQVKSIISSRDIGGKSLISLAIKSKSVETFRAVMSVVVDYLHEEEVKQMILREGNQGYELLLMAIITGKVEMFEEAMVTFSDKFTEAEVRSVISSRDHGGTRLLCWAIKSRNVEMFKVVMDVVVTYLVEDEVKSVISSRDDNGDMLLSLAVRSKSVAMFRAVMVVVVNHILEEEVVELLCAKDSLYRRTPLGDAIKHDTLGMCETILRKVQGYLSHTKAGVITEAGEIKRNLNIYQQDPWNCFDALALVMLAGGFFVRLADAGSPWGRALYALSAPLVFSRILFFVQVLQFQGPMIQVMFSMGLVLLQFAVVLLVVMMGFAMALYPLLRDDNGFTFDAILLLLFKTLLGDVEAFDEFAVDEFDAKEQNRFSTVGRLLLVVYLVVMTIMLLNLLIAVLSTKHTNVDANTDKAFKVSRARIIEHYRLAVAFDILPAPFNLPQLVLTLLFLRKGQSAAYTKIMGAVGQVSFWLVLSPLAFAGGVLLWVTSSMHYICHTPQLLLFPRTSLQGLAVGLLYNIVSFLKRALGAPLCLLALWLRQPFLFVCNVVTPSKIRRSRRERGDSNLSASASGHGTSGVDVQKMLEDAGTGASDLRKYLEDPMCDPVVRSDEVDRGTTVKHMKLLRDCLEKKFNERVDELGVEFNERIDHLEKKFNERVDSLATNTNALVSEANRKIELVLEMLQRK